jgi:hypothetical protein
MTAAICVATKSQPASVCATEPIQTIMQSLSSSQTGSVPVNNQPAVSLAAFTVPGMSLRAYA